MSDVASEKLERKIEFNRKKERKVFLAEINKGVYDIKDIISRRRRADNTVQLMKRYIKEIREDIEEVQKSVSIKHRQRVCLFLLPRIELCTEFLNADDSTLLPYFYVYQGKAYSILGMVDKAIAAYEKAYDTYRGLDKTDLILAQSKEICDKIIGLVPTHMGAKKNFLELEILNLQTTVPILSDLPPEEFQNVYIFFSMQQLSRGETLNAGDGDGKFSFFIVLKGEVEVLPEGKERVVIKKGEFYGAENLLLTKAVDFTVNAQTGTQLLSLDRFGFQEACSYSSVFKRTFEEKVGLSTEKIGGHEKRISERFPIRMEITRSNANPDDPPELIYARDICTTGLGLVSLTPPKEGEVFTANIPFVDLPLPIRDHMLMRVEDNRSASEKTPHPLHFKIMIEIRRVYRLGGKNVFRIGAEFITDPWVD